MTTETVDKLFLELSQFTQAKTAREIELEKRVDALNQALKYDVDDFKHWRIHGGGQGLPQDCEGKGAGMSKHTQGPWEFVDNSLVGPKIDNKPVWLRPVILRSETGIAEADARLIAAAPDLLEALEQLVAVKDYSDWVWGAEFDWKAARAAIAKARDEV